MGGFIHFLLTLLMLHRVITSGTPSLLTTHRSLFTPVRPGEYYSRSHFFAHLAHLAHVAPRHISNPLSLHPSPVPGRAPGLPEIVHYRKNGAATLLALHAPATAPESHNKFPIY